MKGTSSKKGPKEPSLKAKNLGKEVTLEDTQKSIVDSELSKEIAIHLKTDGDQKQDISATIQNNGNDQPLLI